jgi:hypothetical protein
MLKKIGTLFLFLLPTVLFAQTIIYSDANSQRKKQTQCDNRIFTKSEEMPSLKISKEAFEDTLAVRLKSNGISISNGTIKYRFIVTTQSEIVDITVDSGDESKNKKLSAIILDLEDLWNPAKQNSFPVCAYVNVEVRFIDTKLKVNLSQTLSKRF